MSPTGTSNIYIYLLYTSINIKFILSIYQEKINLESNTNIKLVSKYFILIFARYGKKKPILRPVLYVQLVIPFGTCSGGRPSAQYYERY